MTVFYSGCVTAVTSLVKAIAFEMHNRQESASCIVYIPLLDEYLIKVFNFSEGFRVDPSVCSVQQVNSRKLLVVYFQAAPVSKVLSLLSFSGRLEKAVCDCLRMPRG